MWDIPSVLRTSDGKSGCLSTCGMMSARERSPSSGWSSFHNSEFTTAIESNASGSYWGLGVRESGREGGEGEEERGGRGGEGREGEGG